MWVNEVDAMKARCVVAALLVMMVSVGLVSDAMAHGPPGATGAPVSTKGSPQASEGGDWAPYDYDHPGRGSHAISSGALVLVAFGLMWLVLACYLFLLVLRHRKAKAELDALRASVAEGGEAEGHGSAEAFSAESDR